MEIFRLIQILSLILGISNLSTAQNEPKAIYYLKCLHRPNDCILYETFPKVDIEIEPESEMKV